MEYCNDSSGVETLFQCTQHLLGRYVQFPDQSRRESMPLHLFISKKGCVHVIVYLLLYRNRCIHFNIHQDKMLYNAGLQIMELVT